MPNLIPTEGTVLSMTPAAGLVHFHVGQEHWTLPLVGFAVEVSYVDTDTSEYETTIYPVVLDEEEYAVTVRDYRSLREDAVRLKMRVELAR